MEYNFCGVVLEVWYEGLGNTAEIDILSRPMSAWVGLALGGMPFSSVKFHEDIPLPQLVLPHASTDSEFVVVLYSDTPLISKKTVFDAITTLCQNGLNVLRMTRGWVFRTEYLLKAQQIYSERTYYFEEEDFITVFNFRQLAMAREFLKNRIINFHLENGVDIEDVASTFIGPDVTIGKGVRIAPFNVIMGKSVVRDCVRLGAHNNICSAAIERGASIEYSFLEKCYIGEGARIGPYSYLRPAAIIGKNCRIGDFVEIKNSRIGDETKIAHLTYVGDCEIGSGCNIGCGVVFANYDGEKKYKTIVGNNVFVGSNSNIVAPRVLGDGAFVAAGSTLTQNVPEGALAIARARQENKLGWRKKGATEGR